MTHLCYTLEEASQRLNLSETVLVRLSQYFKVPQSAYEEAGYLSFKGDLSFSDQDIEFFRQVRERLLAGESLEEVKARIRYGHVSVPPAAPVAPAPAGPAPSVSRPALPAAQPAAPREVNPSPPAAMTAPLREVVDRAPFEEAARQSFDRYKQNHRYGLGRVFENMLKEVGVSREAKKKPFPAIKPLKSKAAESPEWEASPPASLPLPEPIGSSGMSGPETEAPRDSLLPFRPLRKQRTAAPPTQVSSPAVPAEKASMPQTSRPTSRPMRPPVPAEPAPQPASAPVFTEQRLEHSWDEIVGQSAHQPRALNNRLKDAAAHIRERALSQNQSRLRQKPL